MAHPDILADPTGHLQRLLCADLSDAELMRGWFDLHRHILAGGALPAQWCGEETAAGVAHAELLKAARYYAQDMEGDAFEAAKAAALGLHAHAGLVERPCRCGSGDGTPCARCDEERG